MHTTEKQRFVFFGGQGGAEVVAEYLARDHKNTEVLGFLNDFLPKGATIGCHQVLGTFADWRDLPGDVVFNAPLHKAKEMPKRAKIIRELGIPDNRWGTVVGLQANLARTAEIGRGSAVGDFSCVLPGTKIGHHVALRQGSYIGHDCQIDDFCFVGVNAAVLGYCRTGEGAHIGPGSVVRDGVKIGRYAVVGVGSAVVSDVRDYEIVAGNPARVFGYVEKA